MIYDVSDLRFSYQKTSPPTLNGVSLKLREGELLTVLGKNGSGKSTLFQCMLGLLKPESGNITLAGRPLERLRPREIASVVGFVPQSHNPTYGYTVFEFVLMGCAGSVGMLSHPGKEEKKRASDALAAMGIADFADRAYTELSGGERQQVTIARAIAAQPQAIIFDEPTAHLDLGKQIQVLRIIRSLCDKGFAVAVSTHDPNHAFLLGGNVALMDGRGGLQIGTANEMVREDRLREIYGADLKLRYLEEFDREVCICPSL